MIRRIGQVAITVQDTERARAFYRDVVGLEHLFDAPPGLSFFRCGDIRLMLGPKEGEQEGVPTIMLYYETDDLQATYDAFRSGGAEIASEPHIVHRTPEMELWMAFFRDGEGNTFGVMSEVPLGAPRA